MILRNLWPSGNQHSIPFCSRKAEKSIWEIQLCDDQLCVGCSICLQGFGVVCYSRRQEALFAEISATIITFAIWPLIIGWAYHQRDRSTNSSERYHKWQAILSVVTLEIDLLMAGYLFKLFSKQSSILGAFTGSISIQALT